MRTLSQADIAATLAAGEFPASVREAAPAVAVLMSQSWCPQWHDMASWIDAYDSRLAVFALVYDTRPDFARIMEFKEEVFGNREIPYLRLYRGGRLVHESNWLPRRTFEALLARHGI